MNSLIPIHTRPPDPNLANDETHLANMMKRSLRISEDLKDEYHIAKYACVSHGRRRKVAKVSHEQVQQELAQDRDGMSLYCHPVSYLSEVVQCRDCHQFGHANKTNKKCLQYRPRKRLAIFDQAPDGYVQQATVKIGLKKLLRPEVQVKVMAEVQVIGHEVTGALWEGSRFLNKFVLASLSNGTELPELTRNQGGVLEQVFFGFCRKSDNAQVRRLASNPVIEEALQEYCTEHRNGSDYWDACGVQQIFKAAVQQYQANCVANYTTNLPERLRKLVRVRLREHVWFICLTAYQREKLVDHVIDIVQQNPGEAQTAPIPCPLDKRFLKPFVDIKDLPPVTEVKDGQEQQRPATLLDVSDADAEEHLVVMRNALHEVTQEVWRVLDHQTIYPPRLKAKWFLYVKSMHTLLNIFTGLRDLDPRRYRSLRPFNLLPMVTFTRQYIRMDTTGFFQLLKRAEAWPDFPTHAAFKKMSNQEHLAIWNRALRLNRVTTRNRRFGFSISTDGLGVSASVVRQVIRRRVPVPVNEYGSTITENKKDSRYVPVKMYRVTGHEYDFGPYDQLVPLYDTIEWRSFTVLDPGQNEFYVARRDDTELKCSNERWQEISGTTDSKKQQRLWNARRPELARVLSSTPSPKVLTADDFSEYLNHIYPHVFGELGLLEYFGAWRWRRLRWKTMIKREQAYHTVINELAPNASDVVIYGDGRWGGVKGTAKVPTKELYNRLRKARETRKLREAYTSQRCSDDFAQLKGLRPWALKRCELCHVCVVYVYFDTYRMLCR